MDDPPHGLVAKTLPHSGMMVRKGTSGRQPPKDHQNCECDSGLLADPRDQAICGDQAIRDTEAAGADRPGNVGGKLLTTKRIIARGSVAAGVVGLGLAAVLTGVNGSASAVAARNDEKTCHATTVISARGMGEGWSADGDGFLSPFVNGIKGSDVNAISLKYANNSMGGMQEGAAKLAGMMNDLQKRCPNTKLVLAGWSMGGGVVSGALGSSNPSILVAAVTFGAGPSNGGAGGKIRAFCADGDNVCGGNGGRGSDGPGGHGSYMGEPFLSKALQFANSRLGGGGSADSGPQSGPGSSPGSSPGTSPGASPSPGRSGGSSPGPSGMNPEMPSLRR